MSKVDLKKVPYQLSDTQIKWVDDTIAGMSIEEKIGQLFIVLNRQHDFPHIDKMCERYHVGGIRWQGGTLDVVYEQNKRYQEKSKIPVLIASNCEAGGNGAVKEGTLVAPPPACGASSPEVAREVGRVSGKEAVAFGCNWTFAPISDLLLNWRNTIVNNRAYGNEVDTVIECAKAYMEGIHESNMICCTKHFPGDGSEERDQHLVMGCNDLSCEDWDKTYGKVYKALFEAGVESVMVGHICQPAYSKKLRPGMKDEEIMPATLSPELLQDLLRDQLGFNGLVLTDASHMAGLTCAAPRSVQVPLAIASGCDMFLFFSDTEEDYQYMMQGYQNGIITEERLQDALRRILGIKAKLGLDNLEFPSREALSEVGCEKHHLVAAQCASRSITLVKDTQNLLPVDPHQQKRVKLYFIESAPVSNLDGTDPAKKVVIEELENAGFTVSAHMSYYEMECENPDIKNRLRFIEPESVETFKQNYDLVMVFVHMKGYAQENNVRVKWSCAHSTEIPWYVHEVPTVCVSLNYTNHLYDLPMMKTFINAYAPSREYIRATIQKIIGQSPFYGKANSTVWCDRWDTRL